ncbi:hypothetical protein [Pseudoalteromonas porphyrae]|nr:hypothetical protein [Pseudoalteromonas porphyrae]
MNYGFLTQDCASIPKPPQDASVVGIKSDLGKALITSNSGSIVKINNAV